MSCLQLADFFQSWQDDLLTGSPPVVFKVGEGIPVPLAPRRVLVVGAPPGQGKTALVNQWGFDALRYQPNLRLLICNVEMTAECLLERELSRVSPMPLTTIQTRHFRESEKYAEKIKAGLREIEKIRDRVAFLKPPYAMENVYREVGKTQADIVILDYIQRFGVKAEGGSQEARQQITEVMNLIRQIANEGKAVIVVSAVARDKMAGKKAYDNMGLGSFRDSSELEFGADDCFILHNCEDGGANKLLKHHKARHGRQQDIPLLFRGEYQRYEVVNAC